MTCMTWRPGKRSSWLSWRPGLYFLSGSVSAAFLGVECLIGSWRSQKGPYHSFLHAHLPGAETTMVLYQASKATPTRLQDERPNWKERVCKRGTRFLLPRVKSLKPWFASWCGSHCMVRTRWRGLRRKRLVAPKCVRLYLRSWHNLSSTSSATESCHGDSSKWRLPIEQVEMSRIIVPAVVVARVCPLQRRYSGDMHGDGYRLRQIAF